MDDASDITVVRQEGVVEGHRIWVVIWSNAQGHSMVDRLEFDALPPYKVIEWTLLGSVGEAYQHGVDIARQIIAKAHPNA